MFANITSILVQIKKKIIIQKKFKYRIRKKSK